MIDGRLENIKNSELMESMISVATKKPKLIQQADFKLSAERTGVAPSTMQGSQETGNIIKELQKNEAKPIDGAFYDARIKRHAFGGMQQAVFVLTNVSAEKEL
jgi:hypothetical protein